MANKKTAPKRAEIKKVEVITETEDTVVAEVSKPEVEKVKVVEYEIILATKTYFIINKDGSNVLIRELNNYKKGDIVSL